MNRPQQHWVLGSFAVFTSIGAVVGGILGYPVFRIFFPVNWKDNGHDWMKAFIDFIEMIPWLTARLVTGTALGVILGILTGLLLGALYVRWTKKAFSEDVELPTPPR